MTNAKPPAGKLTVREWIAVAGLAMSLLGGLMDLRVQVATLGIEVATLRRDLDQRLANVERSPEAQAAHVRAKGSPVLPCLVPEANLVGSGRTATEPAHEATFVRALSGPGPRDTGDGRRSYSPPSWTMVGILRRRQSAIPL